MSVTVNYKGNEIFSLSTDSSKKLTTSGEYCEADIEVVNTQDGGITPSGSQTFTENGTYDVSSLAEAIVNISGGSGALFEQGTVAFHTGSYAKTAIIPIPDAAKDNYILLMLATNVWKKIDGEWVERNSFDCTELDTSNSLLPGTICSSLREMSVIDRAGEDISTNLRASLPIYRYNSNIIHDAGDFAPVADVANSQISITIPNDKYVYICTPTAGVTYRYVIVGWNNA